MCEIKKQTASTTFNVSVFFMLLRAPWRVKRTVVMHSVFPRNLWGSYVYPTYASTRSPRKGRSRAFLVPLLQLLAHFLPYPCDGRSAILVSPSRFFEIVDSRAFRRNKTNDSTFLKVLPFRCRKHDAFRNKQSRCPFPKPLFR